MALRAAETGIESRQSVYDPMVEALASRLKKAYGWKVEDDEISIIGRVVEAQLFGSSEIAALLGSEDALEVNYGLIDPFALKFLHNRSNAFDMVSQPKSYKTLHGPKGPQSLEASQRYTLTVFPAPTKSASVNSKLSKTVFP